MRELAKVGFGLALALASAPLPAADERRIAWLREHAVPLATIDPAAALDDLDFLTADLAGVRVVLLGEATRGDGGAFLAKARLVRYLHERLGFDLLAFECGFYDCARSWSELRAGADARAALGRTLFPQYVEAAEFQPLVELLAARARSTRPLEITGIDPQSSPDAARELLAELRAALGGGAIDPTAAAALAELAPILHDLADEAYATGAAEVPAERERSAFLAALARLRERLAEPAAADDAAWWRQVLANVASWAEGSWRMGRFDPATPQPPGLHNLRDRQMAENLLWLANRHPGRKIVVWSLTVHLARDVDRLVTGDPALRARLGRMSGVGDLVAAALGDAAYVLAVTAAEGAKGTPFRAPSPLLAPTRGSFEDLMTRAGFAMAFVDLRRLAAGGEWLGRPLVAKPVSYVELLGRWPRHLDGLLFLRAMAPARRAPPVVP